MASLPNLQPRNLQQQSENQNAINSPSNQSSHKNEAPTHHFARGRQSQPFKTPLSLASKNPASYGASGFEDEGAFIDWQKNQAAANMGNQYMQYAKLAKRNVGSAGAIFNESDLNMVQQEKESAHKRDQLIMLN